MKNQIGYFKDGVMIALLSIILMALSFLIYFLLFYLFETLTNQEDRYYFVTPLRIIYGLTWLAAGLLIFKTSIHDKIKAIIFAASLTSFFASIGVQLYQTMWIVIIIICVLVCGLVIFFIKTKKPWYFYLTLILALMGTIIYY